MTRYAIGLGSNVGDRRQHLIEACHELADVFGSPIVSGLYETTPVGGPDQGPFLNAVAVVESDMGPLSVLDLLNEIERRHGRERGVHWGPRTLDLDLVASSGEPHSDDRLTLPHPRASQREFVLRPLSDVWPEASVGHGLTAAAALDRIDPQGVECISSDWVSGF